MQFCTTWQIPSWFLQDQECYRKQIVVAMIILPYTDDLVTDRTHYQHTDNFATYVIHKYFDNIVKELALAFLANKLS